MAKEKMDEIRQMFKERLNLKQLDETKSLKDLGLDYLDVVEMCLELEEKFDIQFETEELSNFKTIGDLFASIEKKLNQLSKQTKKAGSFVPVFSFCYILHLEQM